MPLHNSFRVNKVYILLPFLLILLSACGGGSSGESSSSRVKWSYDVGSETYIYYSSVALSVDENTIYVGTSKKVHSEPSRSDSLIALNRNGSLKWKYELTGGEEVRSSPVVADNKIYFIADYRTGGFSKKYSTLFCLKEVDGTLLFKKEISDNTSMNSTGLSKVVVKDNKVFVAMKHNYIFDSSTGEELYKSVGSFGSDNYYNPIIVGSEALIIVGGSLSFTSFDDFSTRSITLDSPYAVRSTPAVDSNKNIYVGTEAGDVISFDIDGNLNWKREFNITNSVEGPYIRSSIAIDESKGLIYFGTKDNNKSKFIALNKATGETHWEYEIGGDVYSSPLIGNNGRIYFGSESRNVYALNSDGSLAWKVGVSQDITWPSPTIDKQGVIYIGGMGNGNSHGKIFAIQTDSSGLLTGTWSKIHKTNQNSGY